MTTIPEWLEAWGRCIKADDMRDPEAIRSNFWELHRILSTIYADPDIELVRVCRQCGELAGEVHICRGR